jgi:mannose-1-phosphate guanylyltransferase
MNKYIVILAGGVGSRFWPSSTESNPKQFLDILGVGKSLIRMTYERVRDVVPEGNIIVLTHGDYKTLVKVHLPELKDSDILCEPIRNNTAPCIAYALLNIEARHKNEPCSFAVLPSDHIILKEEIFKSHLRHAFDLVENNDQIITLGIKPTRPDTGYGYIKTESMNDSPMKVEEFKEKPTMVAAIEYLESGNYLWNGGMFVWSVASLRKAFEDFAPTILEVLEQDKSKFNTTDEEDYINEVYHLTPSISVDYAILENASNIYTIKADIGWSDLGTWDSLYCHCEKDDSSNLVFDNNAVLLEVTSSVIKTNPKKKNVIRGLNNYIIIDEEDALLIFPKDKEQEIKSAIQNFKK